MTSTPGKDDKGPDGKEWAKTEAGYAHVETMLARADDKHNLMWHGWALREAFVAGAEWQEARAEISRALRSVTPDGWQDIATAPKDGTRILIFYRWAHRDRFISEGWWSERTQQWNAPHNTMVRATHWRPLPSPPSVTTTPDTGREG